MSVENMELKPNSHKYKQEQLDKQKEKKSIQPVVKNKAVKKKNVGRKVANSLVAENLSTVTSYIVMDVLVPAAKKAISDIVTNGIDMILYGESGRKNRQRTTASTISYDRYYDRDRYRRDDRYDRYDRYDSRGRSSYRASSYDDVILPSRVLAEEVLDRMFEILEEYKMISVGDFYELCDVSTEYTDYKKGWYSLEGAKVTRVRDGFSFSFPKPTPL